MAFVLPPPDESKQKWTQDESIAYECAIEAINDLMSIHTRQINEESRKPVQDKNRLAILEAEFDRLARERAKLYLADEAEIARIRKEYGALIREWRNRPHVETE